jgi:ribosome maturation factor RimP
LAHFLFLLQENLGLSATHEQVLAMLEPAVEALGFELVELELRLGRGHGLVRLFIDAEDGITVDDCAKVSRQVSGLLDVEDPIPGDYSLEVSSPGLDRKLSRAADFERFAGCQIKLQLLQMIDGRRKLTGQLLRLEGEAVVLNIDGQEFSVPMVAIEVARLVPDLSAGSAISDSAKAS